MSELITIEGSLRTGRGKGYARRLRAAGKIPANILNKQQATAIELDPKFLSVAWKSGKKFNLVLKGETKTVSIKELQIDVVKRSPLHVDLMYT